MPKINYSKIESAMDDAKLKQLIERLAEMTAIVMLSQDPNSKKVSEKVAAEILKKLQTELEFLKKGSITSYQQLNLTEEDEKRLLKAPKDFSSDDWKKLHELKEALMALRKELRGKANTKFEDEDLIEEERLKHINKRFNIKDDWLPLH